jgi:signal transduction histidine kinase
MLTVMISDDGIGGADITSPGLSGLADRVSGVDGRLSVESPSGGPTIIAAELPCG